MLAETADIVTFSFMSVSSVTLCSKANASDSKTTPSATVLKFTSSFIWFFPFASRRAKRSISPTSLLIRFTWLPMLSSHFFCSSVKLSEELLSMDKSVLMMVIGVFSSCEAFATSSCCFSKAFSTGAMFLFAQLTEIKAMAIIPTLPATIVIIIIRIRLLYSSV